MPNRARKRQRKRAARRLGTRRLAASPKPSDEQEATPAIAGVETREEEGRDDEQGPLQRQEEGLARAKDSPRAARAPLIAWLKERGYGTYDHYLASEHWEQAKRTWDAEWYRLTDKPGLECSVCSMSVAQVTAAGRSLSIQHHHISYERMAAPRFDDIVLLCEHCHDVAHELERGGVALHEAHLHVSEERRRRADATG
jgi:hypothetical protein